MGHTKPNQHICGSIPLTLLLANELGSCYCFLTVLGVLYLSYLILKTMACWYFTDEDSEAQGGLICHLKPHVQCLGESFSLCSHDSGSSATLPVVGKQYTHLVPCICEASFIWRTETESITFFLWWLGGRKERINIYWLICTRQI